MTLFRPPGLQRRIMLLVVVGLAFIFTVGGFLGLSAIDEASEQVFRERLATAHSTVAVLERDLDRLAADIELVTEMLRGDGSTTPESAAGQLLQRIGSEDRYPFFSVVEVVLLDQAGVPVAMTTELPARQEPAGDPFGQPAASEVTVERAAWTISGEVPFIDMTVPVSMPMLPEVGWAVARTVSSNRSTPFDPAASAGTTDQDLGSAEAAEPEDPYNLEVVGADGMTLLSIGESTPAGTMSAHLEAIGPSLADRSVAALVDDRASDPHVMAGVPIADSPLYLILEQPVDVALALPNQLRERLFILIGIGFGAALLVAWFTTRRVVKPTEELTRAASRMAEGDLSQPIDVSGYDEVATLAATLEVMRQRLLDAQTQLVEINRDLEQRIAERTARLGFVLRKTISAQEEERHALARELHDETAQTIAALSIALDRAREDAVTAPDHGLERIGEAKAIATRLLDEIRRLIMGLRPSILDDLGLGPAIAWYAETVMSERDRPTEVKVDAPAERIPRHLEIALFRIAQEALNNVAKHSDASWAEVRIRRDGEQVELRVEDDGAGFDVDAALARASGSGGVGIAGMQERVLLLGGTMMITSVTGRGTVVVARVPAREEEAN